MKPFGNKFFILFLILTVSLFFFSAKAAYAEGVIDAIGSVFSAIVTVVSTVTNVLTNLIIGSLEMMIGTVIGGPLLSDGECRLENLSDNFFQVFGDSCNTSASIVITSTDTGCAFSYQPKFYIPQKDVGFKWDLVGTSGGGYDDVGNPIPITPIYSCVQTTIDENNNSVALYRFVRPNSISQSELSDWYFQIKNMVGNGFLYLGDYQYNSVSYYGGISDTSNKYYAALTDSAPLVTFPYSTSCSGNVCDKIADFSIPPDSYVIYAAKILGNYVGANTYITSDESGFAWYKTCEIYPGLNKFLNNNNAGSTDLANQSAGLGNALIGPIKTGSCPTPTSTPVLVLGDFNLSLGGSVACNSAPLSWTAASGANGYRILRGAARVDVSPYQTYTALNFTDTTISQNTSYIYQIEAYNAGGTNRSNAINVGTPYCPPTVDIKANGSDGPISIYQGQSVTLSWSSTNSTSMMTSMLGDITKELSASGFVFLSPLLSVASAASGDWSGLISLNGSQVVVPLPPSATFTLTGSGPGGSASDSVTVDVTPLAVPDWREIIPR